MVGCLVQAGATAGPGATARVPERSAVASSATAPAPPASAKTAAGPALSATAPAPAAPSDAPIAIAVASQANASVAVPAGAARSTIAYRARRDALLEVLAEALPEASVHGITGGLHATIQLPEGYDEDAIRDEARRRRIRFNTMRDYRPEGDTGALTVMLGYAQLPEPAIRAGIRELAEAIRAARRAS